MSMIKEYYPVNIKSVDVKMKMILTSEIPVCQRAIRLSITEQIIILKQIQKLLELSIIKLYCSDFASPIVLCKTKNRSSGLCVDYRKLNKNVVKDRFQLLLIEDVVEELEDSSIFTALD